MRTSQSLQKYFNIRTQTRAHMFLRTAATVRWLYPALIMLAVIVVSLTTFSYPAIAIRPFLIMIFLLVCPGLTVVRFFQLHEVIIEWLLALAFSIAIDAFVAGILAYAGRWSPINIFIVLLSFCLLGAIIQFVSMIHFNKLWRQGAYRSRVITKMNK